VDQHHNVKLISVPASYSSGNFRATVFLRKCSATAVAATARGWSRRC